MMKEVTQQFTTDIVRNMNRTLEEVMEKNGVTLDQLAMWEGPDGSRMVHLNGKPLLKFWPLEIWTERGADGSVHHKSTQKYKTYS